MIDKIEKYLSSHDIEMVRLGVALMRENIPQDQWDALLVRNSKRDGTLFPSYRWRYSITGDEVIVWTQDEGVWSQLDTISNSVYKMDNFNIDMLKNALESYNKQSNNNE